MRLAGYCRASIEKGKEGLEGQRERMAAWADRAGHDVEIVAETASAKEGSPRPAFDDLMERVLDGEFDGLVVEKLDRFGRSLTDIVLTTDRLKDAGKTFIAFGNGLRLEPDDDDPMTRMFFQLLAVFAEFERAIIVERLRLGRERAKAQGKHLGRPPRVFSDEEMEEIMKNRELGASWAFLGRAFDMAPRWLKEHVRRYKEGEYPYGPKKVES